MKTSIKTSDNHCEETVSYKHFIKGINKTRAFLQRSALLNKRNNSSDTCKCINNKILLNNSTTKKNSLDNDSVGEEGSAQLIRSPIVKRKQSSSLIEEDLKIETLLTTEKKTEDIQEKYMTTLQENNSLKQESQILKTQIKKLKNIVKNLNRKIEEYRNEYKRLNEKINNMILDNSKLLQENEKLLEILHENDRSCPSMKQYLQDDLEQKILSLDREKEEKNEQCLQILIKFLSYLNEFSSSEE